MSKRESKAVSPFLIEPMGGRGDCRKGTQERDGKFEREGDEFG